MAARKYCLVLAVVTGILCVPVFGGAQLPRCGAAILKGTDGICVEISVLRNHLSKDDPLWAKLQATIEQAFNAAGIKMVFMPVFDAAAKKSLESESKIAARLKVTIDMLRINDSRQYVFHTQIFLAEKVYLTKEQSSSHWADIWKTRPVMRPAKAEELSAEIADAVPAQIETFINAYRTANPQVSRPCDANDVGPAGRQRVAPAAKAVIAEYKYVASKNSEVFHKPQCSSVKRIAAGNLTGYNSRAEAIKAGKRPCKRCKP